jgi:hypothetical protein
LHTIFGDLSLREHIAWACPRQIYRRLRAVFFALYIP